MTDHKVTNTKNNLRILVVEDSTGGRNLALRMLDNLGYKNVVAAKNAEEALRILAGNAPFDLLFTDVLMPGITGIDLARALRARGCGIKVLFTSGFADLTADIIKEFKASFLPKPYRRTELAEILKTIVENWN